MTSPTNRTDEVRKIAQGVVDKWYGSDDFEMTRAIASAITSAVEAERERCAMVAQLRYYDPSHMSPSAHHRIGLGIATAIRQTPTQEGV